MFILIRKIGLEIIHFTLIRWLKDNFIIFLIKIIESLKLSMSLKCLILVKMFVKNLDIRFKPFLDKGIT